MEEPNKMSLGERLREVRGALTQVEMAEKLGAHKNTLAAWERDERLPDAGALIKLLEIYPKLNPNWLLTGRGTLEVNQPADVGYVMTPRHDVSSGAGGEALTMNEQVVDYVTFRKDWLQGTLGLAPKSFSLIEVKGDSMRPTLSDGDLVVVDLQTTRVEDNAIYVLQFDGSLLVKRIQRKLDGSVVVRSDNPLYEPETLKSSQAEDLQVIGRVVWMGVKV
ncbi:helix-turn-helix domain-containing protein [Geoalkalibacter halelectricus]|nr:helix-turn-helix domain-containing protein [Geoalkalibacter halelectricus]